VIFKTKHPFWGEIYSGLIAIKAFLKSFSTLFWNASHQHLKIENKTYLVPYILTTIIASIITLIDAKHKQTYLPCN